MTLSVAQLQALRNDIAANANTIPAGQVWTGSFAGVAGWYSQVASPAYYLIRSDTPVGDVLNNVSWANFTPSPAITGTNAAQATAASMYCQGKMLNLQTMLAGRDTFDATRASQTAGLKDATTLLPSGTGFASQTGGWPTLIPILQRQARYVEKLLAVANATVTALQNAASVRGSQYDGTNGNPDLPGYEGAITGDDILAARNS
jgi:hypothetical protein